MKLSNSWYNVIKYVVTIFLPGVGALYFALAGIWHLPYADRVTGTVSAVAVFLGLLIGYSTHQYNKSEGRPDGDLIVSQVDGEKYLALGVNNSIESMQAKDQVKLNVVDKTAPPEA